jgi:hypothetical protein
MNDSQISALSDQPATGSDIGDIFKVADDALNNRSGFNSEALTRIRDICRGSLKRTSNWQRNPNHKIIEFRSTPNVPPEAPC